MARDGGLPSHRAFLTKLLSAVPETIQGRSVANPLADFATDHRQILLTLHVLYPNEFLPALDLLDRRLVTRLLVSREVPKADQATQQDEPECYYVRSAQQQRAGRFATSYDATANYEVRLTAWNCSCPAFAFAAFPSTIDSVLPTNDGGDAGSSTRVAQHHMARLSKAENLGKAPNVRAHDTTPTVGGVYECSNDVPMCKHILACILVERCCLFTDFVEERRVSVAEYAGWAAGWGG